MTLTERRFGKVVARSDPLAVFVPGARRATIRITIRDLVQTAGARLKVPMSVANTGDEPWADAVRLAADEPAPLIRDTRLTATWVPLDVPASVAGGDAEGETGIITTIDVQPIQLAPGRLARVRASLSVPTQVGRWALVIDVTDDIGGSFAALGSAPAVAVFTIVEPRGVKAAE